jgi:hypothetical protein
MSLLPQLEPFRSTSDDPDYKLQFEHVSQLLSESLKQCESQRTEIAVLRKALAQYDQQPLETLLNTISHLQEQLKQKCSCIFNDSHIPDPVDSEPDMETLDIDSSVLKVSRVYKSESKEITVLVRSPQDTDVASSCGDSPNATAKSIMTESPIHYKRTESRNDSYTTENWAVERDALEQELLEKYAEIRYLKQLIIKN